MVNSPMVLLPTFEVALEPSLHGVRLSLTRTKPETLHRKILRTASK